MLESLKGVRIAVLVRKPLLVFFLISSAWGGEFDLGAWLRWVNLWKTQTLLPVSSSRVDLSELSCWNPSKSVPCPFLAHFLQHKVRVCPVPWAGLFGLLSPHLCLLEGLTFVVSLRDAGCLTAPGARQCAVMTPDPGAGGGSLGGSRWRALTVGQAGRAP